MNDKQHPTSEDLVRFLYRDGPEELLRSFQQHIDSCNECAEKVLSWDAVGQRLHEIEPGRASIRALDTIQNDTPLWKWSVALATSLLIGAMIGSWWTANRLEVRVANSEQRIEELQSLNSRLVVASDLDAIEKRLLKSMRKIQQNAESTDNEQQNFRSAFRSLAQQQDKFNRQLEAALTDVFYRQSELENDIGRVADSADRAVGFVFDQIQKTSTNVPERSF